MYLKGGLLPFLIFSAEPNSFLHKSGIEVNGQQLGQDFVQLRQLLNNYIHYKNAKIYGPDLGRSSRKHSKILLKR